MEERINEDEHMFNDDTTIEKKEITLFISKKEFLYVEKEVIIWGLGTSKFGRPLLEIELDGKIGLLNISNSNHNMLLNFFGNKLSDWKGKHVLIKGADLPAFESRLPGVTLTFKMVKGNT